MAGDFGKTSDINGDIIMHIDREDMLELTRRMTIARNCFNRVAGAYMDEEGFIDSLRSPIQSHMQKPMSS